MSTPLAPCRACSSNQVVRNGTIYSGKQNFKCRAGSRQFVQEPQNKVIDQASQDLIDQLLLEKIRLAGIARVTGVSEPWLHYVNAKYQAVPQQLKVGENKGQLTIQCDEMGSFMHHKGNKQ